MPKSFIDDFPAFFDEQCKAEMETFNLSLFQTPTGK